MIEKSIFKDGANKNLTHPKTQKGITLVALVITVIVLLILAIVAINAIQNDGIIKYAQKAKADYESGEEKEKTALDGLLDLINKNASGNRAEQEGTGDNQEQDFESGNEETKEETKEDDVQLIEKITWKDNKDGTFTASNGIEVEIGDYVNYNEGSFSYTPLLANGFGTNVVEENKNSGYILETSEVITEDLKWRVLGINEKGELELISENPTTNKFYLANEEGYKNIENNLNSFCNNLYGQGKNTEGQKVAQNARSININDINRLTNYDPTTLSRYGEKRIFRYPTQEEMDTFTGTKDSKRNIQYSTDNQITWNNITNITCQQFRFLGDTTIINSANPGSVEVYITEYNYHIREELTTDDGFSEEKVTEIVDMINSGGYYWIASPCVGLDINEYYVRWGIHCLTWGSKYCKWFYGSIEEFYGTYSKIRPVVTILSDFSLTGSGEDIGTLDNMWNIT